MDKSVLRSLPVKDRDMFINASIAVGIIGQALTTSEEFICGVVTGDAAKIDVIESIEQARKSIETINVSLGDYLKIYRAWVDQERGARIQPNPNPTGEDNANHAHSGLQTQWWGISR